MDMNWISDPLSTSSKKYLNLPSPVFGRFQNGCNKVVIEPRVVQFWSEIILVISNWTRAARSFDFENHAYGFSPNCTPLSAITIINETLNNFKCTLQIRATSTEELGKLKKKEIIYYESHLVSHRKTPAVSGICLVCHLERNIYFIK